MKKEAILESKCILEQTEGSMVNYGGTYSIFPIAEKSGSFLDKKKRYVFVFKINNSKKEFDTTDNAVSIATYAILSATDDRLIKGENNTFEIFPFSDIKKHSS